MGEELPFQMHSEAASEDGFPGTARGAAGGAHPLEAGPLFSHHRGSGVAGLTVRKVEQVLG